MAATNKTKRAEITAHEDHGFFGPDSVTWTVRSYPTSQTVGLQRAVVVEKLDHDLVAAVDKTRAIRDRPRTRCGRTLRYLDMVASADSRTTSRRPTCSSRCTAKRSESSQRADGRMTRTHRSRLWIHLTAWHSILYAYERYGPGNPTAEEETRCWAECAVAAELQTCDPDDVSRTREGIREHIEQRRPQLVGSDEARSTMKHLLNAKVMFAPVPFLLRPEAWVVSRPLRASTIGTKPRWMRKMGGLHRQRIIGLGVVPITRTSVWLAQLLPRVEVFLLKMISPGTVPDRLAPTDDGIVESESILGAIA